MNWQVKKQVRKLILLFTSSLICASLVVAFLLFHYRQKDEIQIKKALISPDVLSNLKTYQIDFVYFDLNQGAWSSKSIPIKTYEKIYNVIKKDISIKELSSEEMELFSDRFSTRLIIKAESKKSIAPLKQEVEFTSAGTYRIVTFGDSRPLLAYFRHPEIGKKILNLQ